MALAFLCSPHARGASDKVAEIALKAAGGLRRVVLREQLIAPCSGCQACVANGGECVLPRDDANRLFAAMGATDRLLFITPIYFYSVPWLFKLFIDRSQKYWANYQEAPRFKDAYLICIAARKNGDELFAGAIRTISWFLKPFGFAIAHSLCLRGLENARDLTESMERRIIAFTDLLSQD